LSSARFKEVAGRRPEKHYEKAVVPRDATQGGFRVIATDRIVDYISPLSARLLEQTRQVSQHCLVEWAARPDESTFRSMLGCKRKLFV
jgi:hypothetical protein